MRGIALSIALFAFMVGGVLVWQQDVSANMLGDVCKGASNSLVCSSQNKPVEPLFNTVVNFLLWIAIIVGVIFIIISGVKFASSAGNASSVESAKKTLVASVIGILVAIFSYAIIKFVVDNLL